MLPPSKSAELPKQTERMDSQAEQSKDQVIIEGSNKYVGQVVNGLKEGRGTLFYGEGEFKGRRFEG